jgi:teichuronic acid biosynthesis glycosyltransferase TuaC
MCATAVVHKTPAEILPVPAGALRVLFVTNMYPEEERPWYGSFLRTQVESLRQIGLDVTVLHIRGHTGLSAYAGGAARVAALNRKCPFDVVHAHYGHCGVLGRLQLRAPLVISYLGSDLLGIRNSAGSTTPRGHLEVALFRRLSWLAAATITKSEEMARVLPRRCRGRNHVIPNGVDLERFRPIPRDEARRRLGWDPGERVALFVGDQRFAVIKNRALADAVCQRVARTLPGARLRVAARLPPDQLPLWMSAADALLLTSHAEGSPNVVKEAMACELPVVSTPVGDVPERLSELPGCHVRPPEVDALADALADALLHGRVPEARVRIGELSLRRVAERISAVYETVA